MKTQIKCNIGRTVQTGGYINSLGNYIGTFTTVDGERGVECFEGNPYYMQNLMYNNVLNGKAV